MKTGSCEGKFWVHKTKPLCVAIWADNMHVLTLSNHHSPRFVPATEGVYRRKRNEDGTRDQFATCVKIPAQTRRYVETFFRIDQKNKRDAMFDLKMVSKKHNWSPKIVMRLMNMHLGNASIYYERLCHLYTPERRMLSTKDQMIELAHSWCQRGPSMRTYAFYHPPPLRDMSRVFNTGIGRKVKSTAKGVGAQATSMTGTIVAGFASIRDFRKMQQKRSPWRQHQSVPCASRGHCCFDECPGLVNSTAMTPRKTKTNMICEECSLMKGYNVFLCNDIKGKVDGEKEQWNTQNCHQAYHNLKFNNK